MKRLIAILAIVALTGCATLDTYTTPEKIADAKAIATLALVVLGSTPDEAEAEVAEFIERYREEIIRARSLDALVRLVQELVYVDYAEPLAELEAL